MLPTPRVLPQTPRMQAGVRPAGRPAPASACVPADRDAARLGAAAGRLVRPQQDVFGEGEAVRGVLILRRGWAFRYRLLADGRRQIIHFLMAGDPIVLADGVARHSVAALTDAGGVRLPRPAVPPPTVAERPKRKSRPGTRCTGRDPWAGRACRSRCGRSRRDRTGRASQVTATLPFPDTARPRRPASRVRSTPTPCGRRHHDAAHPPCR